MKKKNKKSLGKLEARVAALEAKMGGCCEEPQAAPVVLGSKFRASAVGKPKRLKIGDDLYLCGQIHVVADLKKKGIAHSIATSWLEKEDGKQLGKKTCSCTSGSCSLSKTCDGGIDVSCDCVKCTLSCS